MMLKKLSAVPTRAVLLVGCFLLLGVMSGFAQSKEDLYNKGTAAFSKGDAIGARDAFCAIKDASFKDAAKQCVDSTTAAKVVENLHNQRYFQGLQLIQDGKLDDAETKLKSVKFGDRVADAQRKLQEVADLKQKKAAADAQASQSAAADSAG